MKPIVVPALGETILQVRIVRWLKEIGDAVKEDEPLLEVSTDKLDVALVAPASGVLHEKTAEAGDEVQVGATIGTIAGSQ